MRQAVADGFLPFSVQFEARCDWLYLDVKGLVTVAIGLLVDPISMAQGLEFVHPDGSLATQAEVDQAWQMVKSQQASALQGGGHYARFTSIRMTQAGMQKACTAKLLQMESKLKQLYQDWENFPAKAQLGILSMAWAMGPLFPLRWPKFSMAVQSKDWVTASANCTMSEVGQNASFRARNAANRQLFAAAAQPGDDPEALT